MALVRSGDDVVAATGDDGWLSYDGGDRALLHSSAPPGCTDCCPNHPSPTRRTNHEFRSSPTCSFCTITGGRFQLMHEHWNVAALPDPSWMLPGFAAGPDRTAAPGWSAPKIRAKAFPRLAPKGARAISLLQHPAAAVRAITPSGLGDFKCTPRDFAPVCVPRGPDAPSSTPSLSSAMPPTVAAFFGRTNASSPSHASGASYCYVVDMGVNIQGGINITFRNGVAGQAVAVVASELLVGMNGPHGGAAGPTGMVQPNGTDESVHYDRWTLTAGPQTVVSHEYIVSRFWQVVNAPEPPSASAIHGWKVWYPMGSPSEATGEDSHAGQTAIETDSAALDSVWELCRFTGRTGAMDVNTDSNARQRDNCNVDSHITALHQAAAGPAASAAYRRRNAAFNFEPDAKVHPNCDILFDRPKRTS